MIKVNNKQQINWENVKPEDYRQIRGKLIYQNGNIRKENKVWNESIKCFDVSSFSYYEVELQKACFINGYVTGQLELLEELEQNSEGK